MVSNESLELCRRTVGVRPLRGEKGERRRSRDKGRIIGSAVEERCVEVK